MKTLVATTLAVLLGVAALFAYAAPVSSGPDLQSPPASDDDKDKDKDKKDG
jgi:hypothetical protein